jgi:hypothetical protein
LIRLSCTTFRTGPSARPVEEREALVELARAGQQAALAQEEVRVMSQTIAEFLREEGKKEGLEKGKVLAAQEILVILLRDRFGRVPRAVRQKIEATTDVERLEECVLQAAKINSVDELRL